MSELFDTSRENITPYWDVFGKQLGKEATC